MSFKTIHQDLLDENETAPRRDAFGHKELAEQLYENLTRSPEGKVVAIDASWGRGKSDLLYRVAKLHNEHLIGSIKETDTKPKTLPTLSDLPTRALWLNPWLDKDVSLTGQVAIELSRRAARLGTENDWFERFAPAMGLLAVQGLGLMTAFAAPMLLGPVASAVVPYAVDEIKNLDVVKQATSPKFLTDLTTKLFTALRVEDEAQAPRTITDAFSTVAEALIDENKKLLGSKNREQKDKLFVFIDDIDRCLPERQIAILEEIHALTASNAPVVFMMAIDTSIAASSLSIHYKSSEIDQFLYLDKLFDQRIKLAPSPPFGPFITNLMQTEILWPVRFNPEAGKALLGSYREKLTELLPAETTYDAWLGGVIESVEGAQNQNPRTWQRAMELFAIALGDLLGQRKWIDRPDIIFPWLVLRTRQPGFAATTLSTILSRAKNSTQDKGEAYTIFLTSTSPYLTTWKNRNERDTEEYRDRALLSDDAERDWLLRMLGLTKEYEVETRPFEALHKATFHVIEAFEESCKATGAGSLF